MHPVTLRIFFSEIISAGPHVSCFFLNFALSHPLPLVLSSVLRSVALYIRRCGMFHRNKLIMLFYSVTVVVPKRAVGGYFIFPYPDCLPPRQSIMVFPFPSPPSLVI